MGARKVIFLKGNYYHIFNRGANRQLIFRSNENYRYLLRHVKKHVTKNKVSVIAYCLMPNHYHFLLRQDSTISISNLIQAIFNGYSKAFNKMYGRTGVLFEGRFKSVYVQSEEYLIHLCRYIHRNPIDVSNAKIRDISEWEYSNYPEWIGIRTGELVDINFIKTNFKDSDTYKEFVLEYKPPEKIREAMKSYLLD